ncbi:MAG: ArsR family transcriptional regulator [Candidatus Nanopelagicales bacterium]
MNAESNSTAWVKRRENRARALAALGDPTRLGVMDLLAVQDLSPDALSAALEVPGNLLAHHLKVLEIAGLVQRVQSKNDRRRTYVHALADGLAGLLPESVFIETPRVLFVCTHNSARSVLAEALWHEASDVPSASAGTHPADQINPGALHAASRLGLHIEERPPQRIGDVLRTDDVVVSVCDAVNEELSTLGNIRIHWSIPDPAAIGTPMAFDAAVEELRERVGNLAPRVRHRRSRISSRRASR